MTVDAPLDEKEVYKEQLCAVLDVWVHERFAASLRMGIAGADTGQS
jgi:hypothetical protein